MWKKFVREYLTFTRSERRGIFVLLGIIFLCMIVSYLMPYFISTTNPEDPEFEKAVAEFLAKQKKSTPKTDTIAIHLFYFDPNKIDRKDWQKLGISERTSLTIQHYLEAGGHFYKKEDLKNIYGLSSKNYQRLYPYIRIKKKRKRQKVKHAKEVSLFTFDPNKLSAIGWERLGISKRTALTIQHYLEAGGHFYKKEDLKKIYGFSHKNYNRLAPYIKIQDATKKGTNQNETKRIVSKKRTLFKIDINQADSISWSKLYGIGPVLSARIIRFRKALGGFYKMEQIKEVYGITDSTFDNIKLHLSLSDTSVTQLDINKATFKELKTHPYISYSLAHAIVAFRKQHGDFESVADLKNIQLINEGTFHKLAPYLCIKNK